MAFIVASPKATGGAGGIGNVVGPGSSTDNALARFDGTTGLLIQNSGVILDDANSITGVNSLTVTTLVATTTITTGDNIILLNNDVVGVPTENAGIQVQRGSSTDSVLLWDETIDRWTAGLLGSPSTILLASDEGNLTAAGTDGIVVTGGTGVLIGSASLAQHVADSTHNGYLSQTDWSTFNSKQAAGNYITALTGDITASGPGSVAATLATVNGNVGSFGTASSVGAFTVNAKGLITAASNTSIQIAESQVTNLVSDLAGKQATGNYITALTGDATAAGPGSAALTLATVNGNVGSFTNASITVNAKGLITAASAGSSGITTVGAFSGSSQTNGASISGSTITFGPADSSNPGMVTTGTQSMSGAKTFSTSVATPTLSVTSSAAFTAGTSSTVAAVFNGAASQSVDITQWNPNGVTAGTRARITSAGAFSNNLGISAVEVFGAGASATGVNSVAVGNNANGSTGADNTLLGCNSSISSGAHDSVAIGTSASSPSTNSVVIGVSANTSAGSNSSVVVGFSASSGGNNGVVIGANAVASAGGISIGPGASTNKTYAIAFGNSNAHTFNSASFGPGVNTNADNQLVFGSAALAFGDVFFGKGAVPVASPSAITVQPTPASGTNTAGVSHTILGGQSTGTGVGGVINFKVSPAGSTGSAANAYITAGIISTTGAHTIGAASTTPTHSLNTSSTTGVGAGTLLNVPGGAGNPTGYVSITINGTASYIPYWQ